MRREQVNEISQAWLGESGRSRLPSAEIERILARLPDLAAWTLDGARALYGLGLGAPRRVYTVRADRDHVEVVSEPLHGDRLVVTMEWRPRRAAGAPSLVVQTAWRFTYSEREPLPERYVGWRAIAGQVRIDEHGEETLDRAEEFARALQSRADWRNP